MMDVEDESVLVGAPEDAVIATLARLTYEITNARIQGYFGSQPGSVVTNIEHIRSEIDALMENLSEYENHLEALDAETLGGH